MLVLLEARMPLAQQRAEHIVEDADCDHAEREVAVAFASGHRGAMRAQDRPGCVEERVQRRQGRAGRALVVVEVAHRGPRRQLDEQLPRRLALGLVGPPRPVQRELTEREVDDERLGKAALHRNPWVIACCVRCIDQAIACAFLLKLGTITQRPGCGLTPMKYPGRCRAALTLGSPFAHRASHQVRLRLRPCTRCGSPCSVH